MRRTLATGLLFLLLPACAASTAKKLCMRQGLTVGTAAHSDCTQQLRRQWITEARRDLGEGLALGAIVAIQAKAAQQSSVVPYQTLVRTSQLTTYRWSSQGRLCSFANGTVLNVGAASCPQTISVPR